jgi:hypothetical protein
MSIKLTEHLIRVGISNEFSFIIAYLAEKHSLNEKDLLERALQTQAYLLLADPQTGYYWDSMPEIAERIEKELGLPLS